MAHTTQALARKWRPHHFSELIGQQPVVQALRNALQTGRLHHAYLFTGTRGVGKTTLARILAKCFNCEGGVTDTPCDQCSACQSIDQGRFPDMLEVDAATNTKVEEMRELLDNAQYLPVVGRFKVYIIDEVHMLSRSAFNSMLKTLEEPPEHVKFILATTDPQKVPVTVLSRCLQFALRQMPPDLIAQRLQEILQQEQICFESEALALIARAAQGSVRDALSLLDQAIAHGGGQVQTVAVHEMLGSIEREVLLSLLQALAQQDAPALMAQTERMALQSVSFDRALQELAHLFHDLSLLQRMPQQRQSLGIEEDLQPLSTSWSPAALQLLYQIAVQSRKDLPLAPDETAGFRMALLRMLAFAPGVAPWPTSAQPGVQLDGHPTPKTVASPSAEPAAHQRSEGGKQPLSFKDWPALVKRLEGMGMAQELARYAEFVSFAKGGLQLRLPPEHKHLLGYQEKLRTALEALLDSDLRLEVLQGDRVGESVAAQEQKAQEQRLQQATQALKNDPFVQQVTSVLGGQLVESSIQPNGMKKTGDES